MPTTTELSEFLKERFTAFDSSIDTSDGAPVLVHVLDPLLAKLGTDPFETDLKEFILDRLKEAHPEITLQGDSDVLMDVLVSPLMTFLEPFKREINAIKASQSLQDPTNLAEAELDALLANMFFSRQQGEKAEGVVRMYFSSPLGVTVHRTTKFFTAPGLNFYPVTSQSISSDSMLLNNQEGALFYFDVQVEAELAGAGYNVFADSITATDFTPSPIKVSNPSSMTVLGADREDNSDFLARAEAGLSERSTNTERGLSARLQELYPTIRTIQPIGYRDIEMDRDIIKGTLEATGLGLGAILASGIDGNVAALTKLVGVIPNVKTMGTATTTTRAGRLDLTNPNTLKNADGAPIVGEALAALKGQTLSVFHAGLVPLSSDHTIGGLTSHLDPTTTALEFEDYRWLQITSVTGTTKPLDVVGGAKLPFTNQLQTDTVPAGSLGFLNAVDRSQATDMVFVESQAAAGLGVIAQTGLVIESVSADTLLLIDAPIVVRRKGADGGAGENGPGRFDPGVPPAFTIGIPNEAKALAPDLSGEVLVLRKAADGKLVTHAGGKFFTVGAIPADYDGDANNGSYVAGYKALPIVEVPNNLGNVAMDLKWTVASVAAADLNPAPGAANARMLLATDDGNEADSVGPIYWAVRRDTPGLTLVTGIPQAGGNVAYNVRSMVTAAEASSQITLSDVPGGIVYPNTPEGALTIDNNSIHIGGMTDAHILTSSFTDATVDVEFIDDAPVLSGIRGEAGDNSSTFTIGGVGNQVDNYVQVGDVLWIDPNETTSGTFVVVAVGDTYVTVLNQEAPDAVAFALGEGANNLRFKISRKAKIDLVAPRDTIIPDAYQTADPAVANANTLKTAINSSKVTILTAAGGPMELADQGVKTGDILEITSGIDVGAYTILDPGPGDPGNSQLTLSSILKGGEDNLAYKIYRLGDSGGVARPMLRVSSCELLDASSKPIEGGTIPYADPVDIRSSEFGNRGEGTKLPNLTFTGNDITVTLAGNGELRVVDAAGAVDSSAFSDAKVVVGDIIYWSSGPNVGLTREISAIDYANGVATLAAGIGTLNVDAGPKPNAGTYTLGAPSIGTARCYFLDPTTFEVDQTTKLTTADSLSFAPDPDNQATFYDPELSGVATPGAATNTIEWTSTYRSYQQLGLRIGDYVEVGYFRVEGDIDLVAGLAVGAKSFVIEEFGVSTQTVRFSGVGPIALTTNAGIGGIKEQMADQLSSNFKVEVKTVGQAKYLALSNKNRFKITAGDAVEPLGFDIGDTNYNTNVGTYKVATLVGADVRKITVVDLDQGVADVSTVSFANPATATHQLKFIRPGAQRISSKDMKSQGTSNGLYYFDVQLISSAAGNAYNLTDETYLTITGHSSDGFTMSVENSVLSYSSGEQMYLHLTPRFLQALANVEDSFIGKKVALGQKVRVNYEHAPTVGDVQSTLLADGERVINNNPLARTFFPAYTRFDFTYSSGSTATVVKAALQDHINNLPADTALEAFDLQVVAKNLGASYVKEPLTMVSLVHQKDRTIRGERSADRIKLNRSEHFLAEEDRTVDSEVIELIKVTRS